MWFQRRVPDQVDKVSNFDLALGLAAGSAVVLIAARGAKPTSAATAPLHPKVIDLQP